MPSLRQSVATSTRFGVSDSAAMRCTRSAPGSRPVTASTSTPSFFGRRSRSSAATYSAVSMNRQNTIGWNPSSTRPRTMPTGCDELGVVRRRGAGRRRRPTLAVADRCSGARRRCRCRARRRRPRRSRPCRARSGGRSRRRPRPMSVSAVAARVRIVAAAAAGLDASARSRPSADHQRTRWRCAPDDGSRTVSRA